MATAEESLRGGEPELAESHYREAVLQAWMLEGALERLEGHLAASASAFQSAAAAAAEDRPALQALALVRLQAGEPAAATELLQRLALRDPKDVATRRLLAQVYTAGGRPEQALAELEQARAATPRDLETSFDLACAQLAARHTEAAARLFAAMAAARPIPQTHVLIGRAWADSGEYDRATDELRLALKLGPRTRHAHYLLGTILIAQKGRPALDEAAAEFRAELQLAPTDPLAGLELGVALFDTQREAEALPHLEAAARGVPTPRALYYLGRAQVAVGRPAEGAASLERALELAHAQHDSAGQLRAIENQLGQALARAGAGQEAERHFAEAARLSVQSSATEREQMSEYLAGGRPAEPASPLLPLAEPPALVAMSAEERGQLRSRVKTALARAYLNLGVMQAQQKRFARAAGLFEQAATVDPGFPQVQSSLGVARFNAGEFAQASGPLSMALAMSPQDAGLRRMLAMAWLNTAAYDKAAPLLGEDPELETNPSLQFAYGLALVRSERAAEAEAVFSRLLAQHADSAELRVLIGQAHAQQGDYPAAIEAFEQALRLKTEVAEANGALGYIYLKQGKLKEAEAALRAELRVRPGDFQSKLNVVYALDAQQRSEEAIALLRELVQAKPELAEARYMLGRLLLGQDEVAEAVEHLEAAQRLAPEDANTHYQLGKAYQKLGRAAEAEQQFERFRQLKARR
ncbi:MAG TPA: tetratricopeptide repeat protein [Vicinamibacteria bacterium]|nr:tetratricopeptide repeat protein [Vicinamibacteria bacterium]